MLQLDRVRKYMDEYKLSKYNAEVLVKVKEKGMMQITDAAIHDAVMEVLKENDEQAREYNPEKTRMIDFFVGQVMKKTRCKVNPAKTMEILREELANYNE